MHNANQPNVVRAPAPEFKVRFANLDREATCIEGETIMQSARRSGIRVVGACGGRGVCGTCMVRIVSGKVEFPNAESATSTTGRTGEWVRGCLVRPLGDCTVEVAPRSLAPIVRAEVDGQGAANVPPDPVIHVYEIVLQPATLESGGADADRVVDALRGRGAARFDLMALRELPRLLRANGWRFKAMVRDGEVIGAGPSGSRTLGLAVDLGTTNVAGFIMDLETGTRLASLGIENPQAPYGADVVSRINHATASTEAGADLQRAAVTAIAELARDLCEAVAGDPGEIADIAICGNTAMHHLLLGLPVAQLARAPFVPALREAIDVKARDLGLPAAAGAYAHLLPNVGGFVGGDHVAALLATENRWVHGTTIVMDIGTNTEISLIHNDSITTVSCPSGPALEGGHIASGMRAAEGAIERVLVVNGRLEVETIGGVEPVGICGSGVLDTVAAMLEAGIIDRRGGVRTGHPAVREDGELLDVMLAAGVAFTQHDVRAVQLAKAAIRSSIDLLLREAGLDESGLDQVVIAGAFGAYIGIKSAIAIGLLPPLPLERFAQVGNSAGVGVRMTLASAALRERASRLAKRCRYIELGSLPGFQKIFLSRIGFD